MIRIAVDLMGGDHGPSVIVPGVAKALERHPEIRFTLFGLEADCLPVIARHPALREASTFVPCEVAVSMDDKPSQALRHGRYRSSMWRTIEAVKTGDADVCVSAGNTGALMAMSKFCLRTMANIDRPAIAAIWPTLRGESIVLDVGATIGAAYEAAGNPHTTGTVGYGTARLIPQRPLIDFTVKWLPIHRQADKE